MLTPRAIVPSSTFTRRDLVRLAIGAAFLIVTMTVIFALDLLPRRLVIEVGDVASADIVAPRAQSYPSDILTAEAKDKASRDVDLVYDYSTEKATQIAQVQLATFERQVKPIDRAFEEATKPDEKTSLLENALPGLTDDVRTTL